MADAQAENEKKIEKEKKEKEAKQVIKQIGKQLSGSKSCSNKNNLVKLLEQAMTAFPALKASPDLEHSKSLKLSLRPLSDSLVRHGLLHHKDKYIRLLVGICVYEIIRILAPDPDFSATVFRDIFVLFLNIFGELDDIASPYFERRLILLQTVAKLRVCLQMLDTGCEDLVLKMFKSFFSVVRDDHPQSLISSMSSIVTCIMEEKLEVDSDALCLKGNTSEPLFDMIMQNIIRERKGAACASFRLAVSIVQNSGEKLEQCICQFLTSCILDRDAVVSVVKENYHEIILEMFQIAPQMLLSVAPNLTHELLTDQVDVRIKALNLIRKLLSLPGQSIVREYRHVFVELLNRFSDKSAEVRISALLCGKAFCMSNQPGKESLEVVSAIQGRLLDPEDKVRTEAVGVVCELAKTNLGFASSDLISLAAERLRDKKISVRSEALKKVIELYQEYCTRSAGGLTLRNEHIEEIPCRVLMLCYEKDCQEFRPQSMDLVLADLFPASLSVEEQARHWMFMFSLFKPPHLKALKIILSQKRRLQDGLQEYLDLRNTTEENNYGEAERKVKVLIVKMSACFADLARAKDCFQKLHELKDNGIFRELQQFLHKEAALGSEITKDTYLRELGSRNGLSDFFHLLLTKCSFNIFSSKHVQCILDCLSGDEDEYMHLKKNRVELLLTIIGAFPSLLRGSEKQFQLLLLEKEIPFNDQLIEILAREGRHMSVKLSDVYSSLEKACLEGTRMQSKLAVSAIAALAGTSEQYILSELCKILVDSLCNGQNVPTVLQSLGCVSQHSVSTFEAQEKVIKQYIVEEIFQQNEALHSKDHDYFSEKSKCCDSCQLKVFGLKTLVRSFLPHKRASLGRSINFLLDIIQQMLLTGGFTASTPCAHDAAYIRLVAAKSVLRLSRKWDLHISPQIFRLTVLMAKDQSPLVRRSFASKVHKFLKNHMIPSRYACVFSFVALDSLKELRSNALKYWEEYIMEFGKGAQIHETSAMHGTTNHAVNVVVFLIHVLAHDINFPSPDCRNENVYAQFLSPLFVTLDALVVGRKISNASSHLRSILNAIKKAEDAVDIQMTAKLHLLAEVGICILNSLNTHNTPVLNAPGLIMLPSSLYKSGPAEMREANIFPLIGYKVDASFTKKLISIIKAEISAADNTETNCIKKLNEKSLQPNGINHIRSNPKSSQADNLLLNKTKEQCDKLHARQKVRTPLQEIDISGRQNQIVSSRHGSVGLQNKFSAKNEREGDSCRNSGAKLSFSCISSTTKSLLSHNGVNVSNSVEEDTVSRCINVSAEPSKSPRASEHVNHYSSKIVRSNGEALVGKHIKLWSPIKRCYHSGVVDAFDSTENTHQITYESGEVNTLSLDSEKWEIQGLNHSNGSSPNGQRKDLDAFGFDANQENMPQNRDLRSRKVPQAVKRNKRCKDAVDTSTSEVIDLNANAIAQRTRRQKLY